MSEWTRDVKNTKHKQTDNGALRGDEFQALLTGAPGGKSRVSVGYTEGIEFGAVKVVTTVSLDCDQNEATINEAARLAFEKAVEITRDGWDVLNGKKVIEGKDKA